MLTVVLSGFAAACVLAFAVGGCATVDDRGRAAAEVAAAMFSAVAGDERGSPQSKPVGTSHSATGVEG